MTDRSPPITYLSWSDFYEYTLILAKKIVASDFDFECVLSIQRGGCITGVILSHELNVERMVTLGIRSTASEEMRAKRNEADIYDQKSLDLLFNRKVLLVDDVCNTGRTLSAARKLLDNYNVKSVYSAVTIWDGDDSTLCVADFYGYYTPGWVVFPWEKPTNS